MAAGGPDLEAMSWEERFWVCFHALLTMEARADKAESTLRRLRNPAVPEPVLFQLPEPQPPQKRGRGRPKKQPV